MTPPFYLSRMPYSYFGKWQFVDPDDIVGGTGKPLNKPYNIEQLQELKRGNKHLHEAYTLLTQDFRPQPYPHEEDQRRNPDDVIQQVSEIFNTEMYYGVQIPQESGICMMST